jgi:hypothetical protein
VAVCAFEEESGDETGGGGDASLAGIPATMLCGGKCLLSPFFVQLQTCGCSLQEKCKKSTTKFLFFFFF